MISYVYRQSWQLVLASLAASLICGLAGAELSRTISAGLSRSAENTALAYWFFVLCVLYTVTKSLSEVFLLRLSQRAVLQTRVDISRRILLTSHAKLQALGKPELMVILTSDIAALIGALQQMPLLLSNAVIVLICFAYMATLSWQLFLSLTALLAIGATIYHFVERGPLQNFSMLREQVRRLYEHFRGLIEGSRELQLNARRGDTYVHQVIAPAAVQVSQLYVRTMTRYTWTLNIGSVTFYAIIGLVLFAAPLWLDLPAAALTTFTLVLLFLIRPISELISSLPFLRQGQVAFRRIQQIDNDLSSSAPAGDADDPFAGAEGTSRLELCSASCILPRANDSSFTLGPISLAIEPGTSTFIIGGNGTGKTTLAMLLLGFYPLVSGEIRLNGVALDDSNIDFYRRRFSAIFSDFHLFEQLLDVDDPHLRERARLYIEKLDMDRNVKVVDNRFSTVNLSSGQRKRLALVSAYLEDRPVYIFDEWAADQDPMFKRVFYKSLLPELKARGKTVIVITHDDAYFPDADQVVRLENGILSVQTRVPMPADAEGPCEA